MVIHTGSISEVSSPLCPNMWNATLEYACHDLIAPHIDADLEGVPHASVFHIKPSPKQQDWVDSYKADKDLSILWHHFIDKSSPAPPDIINIVDRYYRAHLREDGVKLEHNKLIKMTDLLLYCWSLKKCDV